MPEQKSEEKLNQSAVVRYMAFAAILALGLGVVVVLHALTVLGNGQTVNFLLSPVVQLLLLGVIVLLSHQAFGVWRRSASLPNARKVQRMTVILLGIVWLLYCIDLYLDPVLNWLLVGR